MMTFWMMLLIKQKKGAEQNNKRKELKSIIDKGKLGRKWTHERVDKVSKETINKTYAKHRQSELNQKGEKTGKALGSMSLIYTLRAFIGWLKSGILKNYSKILRMVRSLKIRWLA